MENRRLFDNKSNQDEEQEYHCEEIDQNELEIVQVTPQLFNKSLEINRSLFSFFLCELTADRQRIVRFSVQSDMEGEHRSCEGSFWCSRQGTAG
jgi:hypothetical protein